MRASGLLAAAGLSAAVLIASSAVAQAASPPPFGFWVSDSGRSQLLVGQDAQCSLGDNFGNITTSGSCSWNGTEAGGILTIMSNQNFQPAPVYFNVLWVDPRTITVWGEYFYLQ